MQTLQLPLMMKMEFDLLLSVRLLGSEKIFNFHQDRSEHDDQLIRSGLFFGNRYSTVSHVWTCRGRRECISHEVK